MLNSPVKSHFPLSGESKITVLKLLHATYAIQEELTADKLKPLWNRLILNVPHTGLINQLVLAR